VSRFRKVVGAVKWIALTYIQRAGAREGCGDGGLGRKYVSTEFKAVAIQREGNSDFSEYW
jgi:hypothetical protein